MAFKFNLTANYTALMWVMWYCRIYLLQANKMPIHSKRYVLIAFQKMQMQKTGPQKHVSEQLQIRIITRAKQLPGSRQVCSNEEICPDWSLIWPTDKHHTPSVKATRSVRLVLAARWTAQVYPPGLKTSTHVLQRLIWLFKVLKYVVKSTKQHAATEVMKYQVYLSLHDWNSHLLLWKSLLWSSR